MSLPSGYKIMTRGYRIKGNVRSGLTATVPFIMPWESAFTFMSQLLPAPSASTINSILWTSPYQLPISLSGAPAFHSMPRISIASPSDGTATRRQISDFQQAIFFNGRCITVNFETPTAIQQISDDPGGLNQLDPANPLTFCEQSIQQTSKIVTRKGSGFTYNGGSFNGKPVPGDIPLLQPEAKLLLKFPKIPVLAWQLFQPYIGKLNLNPILNCVKGALALEGVHSIITPGTDGSFAQNLGLSFAYNGDPTGTVAYSITGNLIPTGMDWNKFPVPDGTYALIQAVGGSNLPPYAYVDFAQIFYTLLTGQINTGV